jgi:hypothetical protein
MIAALHLVDEHTQRRWLAFARPPPLEIRRRLLDTGWRYHGGHRAWQHDDPFAPVPTGVTLADGGLCSYSTLRPSSGFPSIVVRLRSLSAANAPAPA